MSEPRTDLRTWVLVIQRFVELSWTRHATARYASVAFVPILVAVTTPGWWWLPCALGPMLGMVLDLRAYHAFKRLPDQIKAMEENAARKVIGRHVAWLSAITAAYSVPYIFLAFAPHPGPLIGLMFSAGALVICTSLHVMTTRMIFFTSPGIVLGLTANAYALGEGWMGLLGIGLAVLAGGNAIVMARANARTFADLVAAQLHAEEAAEQLERRVEERTAQLAVATKRAQAANRAKSMFLANMSHELRTPLNAVIGYSEIIEEDLESGDTRASAGDLGKIRSAATHLLTLINEILDLSRIESGKLDIKPAPFDIVALLRGALDAVKPTASKNRTTCQINLAPGISIMNADETRVRQCVLNLLSNAAKFTQGGAIALDMRPCRIGRARGVAISVKDTGPGISAENQARLFRPFSQIDNTQTRAHDGAGLGLVITRRLAQAMGGDVQVSSKLGHGATFTLYLPLDMTTTQAQAA